MQKKLSISDKILFISDVHLGGFTDQKNAETEESLIELINFAADNHFQIAILGDLFDYWMEYNDQVPSVGQKVIERFASFNQNHRTLYITGNHDNWTQGFFEACGFDMERDYRLLSIGSQNILLMHGDATGTVLSQLKRPVMHRLLRNKTFIKLYQTILWKPEVGIKLMKHYSRLNRRLLGTLDATVLDKCSNALLKADDIDVMICGHDHIPRIRNYECGTYINLGTFYDHKTLVIYNNKQFKLVCWNRKEKKLIPFKTKHGQY